MKLVIFSTQKDIYKEGSYERERLVKLAKNIEEVHVVLVNVTQKLSSQKVGDNLYIYPTNSSNYFTLYFDAVHVGEAVIRTLKGEQTLILGEDAYYAGLVAIKCAKKTKQRTVLYVGDDIFSKKYISESRDHYLKVLLSKFTLKRATSIRTSCEAIKYSISVKMGVKIESKTFVLPNFIDLDYIRRTPAANDMRDVHTNFHFIILVIASLEKVSNIEMSLHALDAITFEKPRTGMVIVGAGSQKKHLQNLVYQLGLGQNVIFNDVSSDIVSFLKRTDMFLATARYTNDASHLEEASAAGTAIVTTRTGIAYDILKNKDSAFICDPKDLSCVVQGIQKMMQNPILREDFGVKAQKVVMNNFITKEDEFVLTFINSLQDVINDKYIRYETFGYRE